MVSVSSFHFGKSFLKTFDSCVECIESKSSGSILMPPTFKVFGCHLLNADISLRTQGYLDNFRLFGNESSDVYTFIVSKKLTTPLYPLLGISKLA